MGPHEQLALKDDVMRMLVQKYGKLRPEIKDKFFGLIEAVVWQQLSWKAASAVVARLRSIGTTPESIVAHSSILTGVGLSRRKVEYIISIAKAVEQGTLDLEALTWKSDDEVLATLTTMRGIGEWTAQMYLIFCLRREDVLPAGDLGVRKAIGRLYFNGSVPDRKQVLQLGEKWKPVRTYATIYLWKSGTNDSTIPVLTV